jgi:tetratricopeptide (TPR) repeat protein
LKAKEFDQAVEILRILQRDSPSDPVVLYAAYRTYSDLAAKAVATLGQVAPQSAQMHRTLAQALESQDDIAGAIAQYRKVLEVDHQLVGIHFEVGRLILLISQEEAARQQAEKEFEAELALNPRDSNSDYMLGQIYWLRTNAGTAVQHYVRSLEFRPDFVEAHIAVGKVLMTQGELENALAHFADAARLEPKNEAAHYRLAQVYRELGRFEEANREQAVFEQLTESQAPLRRLYEQIQRRPNADQIFGSPDSTP